MSIRNFVAMTAAVIGLASASAYAQPMQCTVNAGVPPAVRGEGLTERVGDVLLNCTGGTPASAGSAVPQSDVTIFLNTNVTSRVLALTSDTWTEALLMIDEPHTQTNPTVPLLACGDASAPDLVGSPGVCAINGTGTGVDVYNGTTGRPNVWQGRLNGNTSITWPGVPIDAPANGTTRVIRITNVRAAAALLGISTILVPNEINMAISVGGSNPVPVINGNTGLTVNGIAASIVAFAFPGIASASVLYSRSFQQSQSNNLSVANGSNYGTAVADFVIVLKEGFNSIFERKNWGYSATGPLEQNQNIPGAVYNTESGFENLGPSFDPSPNPPPTLANTSTPVLATAAFPSYHGMVGAGEADGGTRLMLSFSNVPSGVALFAPVSIPLVLPAAPPAGMQAGTVTGVAYLVSTDSNGVGSTRVNSLVGGAIASCSANVTATGGICPASTGLAQVSGLNGSGLAVYEVYASDPFNFSEQVSIPIVVAYTANTASNLPTPGLATTVTASFAPLSAVSTASSTDPLPRFEAATSTAQSLFSIVGTAPKYTGSLDSATCQTIFGWAADRNRLNQSINVTIYDGNTLLATVAANQLRSDVGTFLGDNGLHGFSWAVPTSLRDGNTHTIHVKYETTSGIDLGGSPKALICGTSYAGSIDSFSCSTGNITGWAADRSRLNQWIAVTLWDGGTQVSSANAANARPDVGAFLGDNGLHGFALNVPANYFDGSTHLLQVHYEASAFQLPGSPVSVNCGGSIPGPIYVGNVDSASCSGISGWVADRNLPSQSIAVSLWDGSTQIASTLANGARPDVGTFLGDNGLHGFTLQLPSAYANGVSHTLQVHFASTAIQVMGSPVTLKCGSSGPGVNYAGNVDSAACNGITGWVADQNRLNTSITVSLWDPATQTQIASTNANVLRRDVGTVLGDNGLHGFTILLPAAYVNGVAHTLQVRYESSSTQVTGSPVTLKCGSSSTGPVNYVGFVDKTSCTGVTGWAADRNRLNQSITITLWDPATQTAVGSTTASALRTDVGGALGDNGLHGFTLPFPVAYTNGVSHTLQVRFESSTTQLTGSPVTFDCNSAAPSYTGNVDILSCSTIAGWAADRNSLNNSITVSIYDGMTLLGTITANGSRPDVGAVLGDNGRHGFSMVTPASVKDGQVHTIVVSPGGSSSLLVGPTSLTCSQ